MIISERNGSMAGQIEEAYQVIAIVELKGMKCGLNLDCRGCGL